MDQERRALVFANNTGVDPVLVDVLRRSAVTPLWPWELADQSVDVALILIDRPVQNAVKICANVRGQERFSGVPILLLLDSLEDEYKPQVSAYVADIIFKPIRVQALQRYLSSRLRSEAGEADNRLMDQQPFGAEINDAQAAETLQAGKEDSRKVKHATMAASFDSAQAEGSDSAGAAASKTKAEEIPPLPDIMPSSRRLLRGVAESSPIIKGGLLCADCQGWVCRREDIFCSRCNRPLVALAGLPDAISFEPLGSHSVGRLIEFNNTGQNPVRMAFKVLSGNHLEDRFSLHTQHAILDSRSTEELLVAFDARGLDLTASYRVDLEIATNEKGGLTRRVELLVERLARARVVAEEVCQFVVGIENEWEFKLSNDGGGSLRLLKVVLDETALDLSGPVVVNGGNTLPVRLRIPGLDLSPGKHPLRMQWEFEHYSPVTVDIIASVVRPARLTAQPSELDFGVVATNRSRRYPLTIFNAGGEELVVESIAPSVEWVECLVETPLRIPPGAPRIFDVQVRGSSDLSGDREGAITIYSDSYNNSVQPVHFRATFIEPEPYEEYIGIDFGTTASCVAVLSRADNRMQPVIIDLDRAEAGSSSDPRIMPSVLYFHDDGKVSAGREALKHSSIQPANAVTSIKRVLGMKHTKVYAGQDYNATQLASKIIDQLVVRTEDGLFQLGQYKTPHRAVVTVPVEFFDNQRRALLEACKLTGLEVKSHTPKGIVIDEAHAAALYYLSKRAEMSGEAERERLLIFDFGGGTLDCVLIEIEAVNGRILLKTLALGGDPRLGGEDIDWALVGRLADMASKAHPEFNLDCLGDESKFKYKFRAPVIEQAALRTRAAFKRQAEVAKITLGMASSVELKIEPLLRCDATPVEPFIMNGLGQAHLRATLGRGDLETVLAPLVERAVGVVHTVCQRAGITPGSVDTILHVGRTSLIPMVRQQVNAVVMNAEDRSHLIEPKLCVALGAALWGYIKDKPSANIEFVGGSNRIIHDIGYLDFKGMKEVFVPVFPAQTEFPVERVIEFPGGKSMLELRFAEGHGKGANGNTNYEVIGTARVDTRGVSTQAIAVGFALDENRMLQVKVNGHAQQIKGVAEQ
ncbi:MAG TPA: Hsp70 family protein [Blastocatellia bacterium]|nr:Hsp70 family protein [Blastocatellia bacterium]